MKEKGNRVQYEIDGYNQDNSILLTPDIRFEAEDGLCSPVVESVRISTIPEDKEIYPADKKSPKGYDQSNLKMKLSDFPNTHILGFFEKLSAMPDKK